MANAGRTAFSLIRNHPFTDGNKRVRHAAMEATLMLNGLELRSAIDEAERVDPRGRGRYDVARRPPGMGAQMRRPCLTRLVVAGQRDDSALEGPRRRAAAAAPRFASVAAVVPEAK